MFGLTIIAGISGDSLSKGVMAACLGLLVSCIGADPMTSRARLTFGVERLYLGLDLAICLIGLFALVQVMTKAERKERPPDSGYVQNRNGPDITKEEKKHAAPDACVLHHRHHHRYHSRNRRIHGLVVQL